MGTVSLRAAQETMEEAAARLESYGQSIARTEAPLDEGARHLLTTAERLRSYVDAGALGRAYHLTKSIDYCRAVNWGKRNLACSTFLVMGPFDNPSRRFFKAPTPVENDILAGKRSAEAYVGKGGKTVAWRRVRSRMTGGSPGFLDFVEICGPAQEAVAYALVYVRSPKRQQVTLLLGSDDSIRAWINRELVVSDFADRGVRPRQAIGRGTLRKGWNTLLFKVDQNVGGWAAYIEILGRRRDALSGVTFSTEFPYN